MHFNGLFIQTTHSIMLRISVFASQALHFTCGLHGSSMHLLYNKDLSFTYKQIYVCTIINKLILRIFSLHTQCVIGIALHFVRRLVVFMGLRCIYCIKTQCVLIRQFYAFSVCIRNASQALHFISFAVWWSSWVSAASKAYSFRDCSA